MGEDGYLKWLYYEREILGREGKVVLKFKDYFGEDSWVRELRGGVNGKKFIKKYSSYDCVRIFNFVGFYKFWYWIYIINFDIGFIVF